MSDQLAVGVMIGLDVLMLVYTAWVISLGDSTRASRIAFVGVMLLWLGILHWILSSRLIFPADISGMSFFFIVMLFVAASGIGLLLSPFRRLLLGLDQSQLLLMQGIRVFFGAGFLIQSALGNLPLAFGIIDGLTHTAAGFFGLVAAYAALSGQQVARRAWFANLFGLADILVVAGSIAFLLLPQITPYHSMMYAVFLPAPLWVWFHLLAIRKLIHGAGGAPQRVLA